MRDSGKASKSAMQGIIKDMNDYTMILHTELNLIMQEAASLSGLWNDDQFKHFLESVEKLQASVAYEIHTLDEVRHELEKKVGLM